MRSSVLPKHKYHHQREAGNSAILDQATHTLIEHQI